MYYNVESWQKIDSNIYDASGKVIIIKQKFLTTPLAIILGGVFAAFPFLYGAGMYVSDVPSDGMYIVLIVAVIEVPVGLWMLVSGLKGKALRKEMGGVHPTDTVYTLDTWGKDLRKRVGDVEEYLSTLEEVTFETKVSKGDNSTQYRLQLTWPTGKEIVYSTTKKQKIEELITNIRTRLGISPQEAPQMSSA